MTLRQDALVAVTMAGAALVLAVISSRGAGVPGKSLSASGDMALLGAYQVYLSKTQGSDSSPETTLASLRAKVRELNRQNRLSSPIDQYRAASILSSSEQQSDLDAAHRLGIQALDAGIEAAGRIVKEIEDRLLLSMGAPQMHGTQNRWRGRKILPVTEPSGSEEGSGAAAPMTSPAQN